MKIYIKGQKGEGLIEKGEILIVGGRNKTSLLTGKDMGNLVSIGELKSEDRAKEILNEIIQRIVQPKVREIEREAIYIDLEGIE